jgi:Gliding motility associated protein GldN
MFKHLLLYVILISLIAFTACNDKDSKNKTNLTKKIMYEMPIKNPYPDPNSTWYVNNIDQADREEFVMMIMDAAKSGDYVVINNNGDEISSEEIDDLFCFNHPIYDSILDTTICYNATDIAYLEFEEKWDYDSITGKIYKEVVSISPTFSIQSEEGFEGFDFHKIFTLKVKQSDEEVEYDKVITERIAYDAYIVNPYDYKQIENYNSINKETRKKYIGLLFDIATNEETQAYDYFFEPISAEYINLMIDSKDTISIMEHEPPYETYDTVVDVSIHAEDVSKIRFMEKWSINTATMQMKKEIVGVALLYSSYGEDGYFRGYVHMFWLFFDEDYQKKLMDEMSS